MKLRDDRGTVLMEFILVMPILILQIFGIAQFSLIWMARLMTYYAAYSGARAAIVYNAKDYAGMDKSGPVHQAACIALSWIGMTYGGSNVEVEGWGEVPGSGYIREQVSVETGDLSEIPAVKVTVHFKYPLLIPYAGSVIGYMAGGHDNYEWDVVGFLSPDISDALEADRENSEVEFFRASGYNFIELTESCIMPRPWSTEHFPKASETDRGLWGITQ